MIYKWINNVQFGSAFTQCVLCGDKTRHNRQLCDPCQDELPVIQQACNICAIPLPVSISVSKREANPADEGGTAAQQDAHQNTRVVCGECQSQPLLTVGESFVPFHYQPPLDYLLHQLKYNGKLHFAQVLSQLMIQQLEQHPQYTRNLDAIIPVPLHVDRLRQRGFNQALEIARPIARHFSIPLITQHYRRIKATPMQSRLSARQRKKNLQGSFQCVKPLQAGRVAIVDDVLTTGQTLRDLAQVIQQQGVSHVDAWMCARVDREAGF